MKRLMKIAWMLVKEYNYSMSKAMLLAWQAYTLKRCMLMGTVEFSYKKTNGSIRQAKGTICPAVMKDKSFAGVLRHEDPNQICYFDVEANDWRSCLITNLNF